MLDSEIGKHHKDGTFKNDTAYVLKYKHSNNTGPIFLKKFLDQTGPLNNQIADSKTEKPCILLPAFTCFCYLIMLAITQ